MPDGSGPVFDPRRILATLIEHGVDFVVVGGIAVQAHGHGRSTRDLDVIPRPDLANLSRLGEALAALDARLIRSAAGVNVTDPQLLKRVPFAPLMTSHGRLDVLNIEHAWSGGYDALRDGSVVVELDVGSVRVAGLDHLIRMKRKAGRQVDLTDIGALTRTDEELEREASEST